MTLSLLNGTVATMGQSSGSVGNANAAIGGGIGSLAEKHFRPIEIEARKIKEQ